MPLQGMNYTCVDAVPAQRLRRGDNQLELACDADEACSAAQALSLRHFEASGDHRRLVPRCVVFGVPVEAARIQSGPVIVDLGTDHAVLACRTSAPVAVTLRADDKAWTSPPGLFHRWRIERWVPGRAFAYEMVLAGSRAQAQGVGRLAPIDGPIRLAICADAGPLPDTWAQNARAIAAHEPHALVFVGDMVSAGREDDDWNRDFLLPARALLASVACYSVLGNHDEDSPLWREFLAPSARGRHWAATLGPAQLVGLDGADDWSLEGPNYAWLDRTLRTRTAAFSFVFNHYPAWSSGPHGRLDAQGQPVEPECRISRDRLLPLLHQHGVTALFSGHDHIYERSHPPGGPVCIVTGGAGAYLYNRGEAAGQNPHSAVYRSAHHHCILDCTPDAARLRVYSLAGEMLDDHVFTPRR